MIHPGITTSCVEEEAQLLPRCADLELGIVTTTCEIVQGLEGEGITLEER